MEPVADSSQGWVATHCLAQALVADGPTKSLLGQAYVKFRGQLGFHQQSLGGFTAERRSESRHGDFKRAAGMLAAASGLLLCTKEAALSGVAICALGSLACGMSEIKKSLQESQEPKNRDEAASSSKDRKPSRSSGGGAQKRASQVGLVVELHKIASRVVLASCERGN